MEAFELLWSALHCFNPMPEIKIGSKQHAIKPDKVIGLGASSIVLLHKNAALKCGNPADLLNEFNIADAIKEANIGLSPKALATNYGFVLKYPRGYPVVESPWAAEIRQLNSSELETLFEKLVLFHGLGYVHKDMRPENIIVVDEIEGKKGKENSGRKQTPYLIDFGFSEKLSSEKTGLCGTISTASQRILLEASKGEETVMYEQEDDLESFLKTVLILDGSASLPIKSESNGKYAAKLHQFWSQETAVNSFLESAAGYSQKAQFIKRHLQGACTESTVYLDGGKL